MTEYIVYNRATGRRVRPRPMSLGRAQALTDYLNSQAGVKQYTYRAVGIFDPEHPEYEGGGGSAPLWVWLAIIILACALFYLLLT